MSNIPKAEGDGHMSLYCDTLVLFLLVESTMGECNLHKELDEALESMDPLKMVACKKRFETLPQELKTRILEGDITAAEEELALPEENVEKTAKNRRTA